MTPPHTPAPERKDLIEIIVSNLPRMTSLPIEPETELRALGADELTFHGLAMDVGDQIGREIPTNEALRWATVSDVARVLGDAA